LKCNECPLKYVEQTGHTFKVQYKEYIQTIKTSKQNSKYAQHILDTEHTFGTIDQPSETSHIKKKGQSLNTPEWFHIYNLSKQGLQMNDNFTHTHNPISDIKLKT
jgi:hypothetical protein